MILLLWHQCSGLNGLVTSYMAPAHPHATSIAMYPALFCRTKKSRKHTLHTLVECVRRLLDWRPTQRQGCQRWKWWNRDAARVRRRSLRQTAPRRKPCMTSNDPSSRGPVCKGPDRHRNFQQFCLMANYNVIRAIKKLNMHYTHWSHQFTPLPHKCWL